MLRHALAALAAVVAFAPAAAAQSPFTYQGELFDAGQPVTTPTDFRFRLFNNPSAGTQVGPDNLESITPGPDGRFSVILDFGPVFGPSGRHLEIAVRPAWDGQGTEPPYTTLTPRALITPTPVALYALNAPTFPVDWTDLLNVPADFADGVDNNTTYGAGLGLNQLGGNFLLDLGFTDARFINAGEPAGGDLSGIFESLSVDALQGTPLAIGTPADGDVLAWNGAAWEPSTITLPAYAAGDGLTLVNETFALESIHTSLELVTGGAAKATFAGRIGINATPTDMLHIDAPAGQDALRVQVEGDTALRVYSNGGLSLLGNNTNTAADTVYVSGKVGIGTPTPLHALEIVGGADVIPWIRIEAPVLGKTGLFTYELVSFENGGTVRSLGELNIYGLAGTTISDSVHVNIGEFGLPIVAIEADAIELDTHDYNLFAFDDVSIRGATIALDGNVTLDDDLNVEGDAFKPGGGMWSVLSDARLKTDIQPMHGALDTITALRPVTFRYRDPAHPLFAPGILRGFIAQDVQHVVPEWVRPAGPAFDTPDAPDALALTMTGFEALATGAIQELDTDLRRINDELRAENAHLRARIDRLERVVERMLGDR
tara:strand:- start:11815 stop:13617 length:1803 start_codon:yes stop_codon:yes gene_type:complete